MSIKIQGKLEDIFSFITNIKDENIIEITGEERLYIKDNNLNSVVLDIEIENIDLKKALERDCLKESTLGSNILNATYKKVKLIDLIGRLGELYPVNEEYIQGKEILILSPEDECIRKKVVKTILNLVKGDLSKVTVGTIDEAKKYLYRIRTIDEKGYLYILKKLEPKGVLVYYRKKEDSYIQMGYKIKDGTYFNLDFFKNEVTQLVAFSQKNNVFLKNFDLDELKPLINTLSFNFNLEKKTEIHAMEYQVEDINKKIEVELSLKKTGYKEVDNLTSKINYHREEMNRLEQIKILKENREISNQIVLIKFSEREKLAKLLSVISGEVISKIKIATIELGDKLEEKYYILFIEDYHLQTSVSEKVYFKECAISHHGINIYLEDNRFLFPFYAMEGEYDEIPKDEYYKLIFGRIENRDLNIESLKKEKNLIIILDSSGDIFKTKEMIFIREKDIKSNVIEVFNERFITDSEELNKIVEKQITKKERNIVAIDNLKKEIQDLMEISLKESGDRLDVLGKEWNTVQKSLKNLEKEIGDKKTDKEFKLKKLLDELINVDDVEKIKNIFFEVYKDIISKGKKQLEEEERFLIQEKKIYDIWRSNWSELESNLEKTKKNYLDTQEKSLKIFDKNSKEINQLTDSGHRIIEKFNKDIIALNKKYEELISKYE